MLKLVAFDKEELSLEGSEARSRTAILFEQPTGLNISKPELLRRLDRARSMSLEETFFRPKRVSDSEA